MHRLFRQFSFPGGIPSHAAPETPGSIHEGGELGYSLSHAYGAVLDNPGLIAACVIGDGEAETGPLAASWHSNKFLNPATRWRGAADPASERLQDRQPDGAGADQPRRAGGAAARLRVCAGVRGGRRPGDDARRDGGGDGWRVRRHRRHPAGGARRGQRFARAADLADDRAAQPEGLDGAEDGGRVEDGGVLALAPGADRGCDQARATSNCSSNGCAATGRRSCSTQAGRLLPEIAALAPAGETADERQPARQRRRADAAAADAGLRRPCRGGAASGRGRGRGDAGDGRVPARRDARQRGEPQFPRVRARTRPTATG